MISDGFECGLRARSASLYDEPDGRMQAVTIDISKILCGLNFLRLSNAKLLSNWKIPDGLFIMSSHTSLSNQSISCVLGYGTPI